jgi:hypothetical protein
MNGKCLTNPQDFCSIFNRYVIVIVVNPAITFTFGKEAEEWWRQGWCRNCRLLAEKELPSWHGYCVAVDLLPHSLYLITILENHMLNNLPEDLQQTIKSYLMSGQFVLAKRLRDQYFDAHQARMRNAIT